MSSIVDKREWRWALVASGLIMLATTLPILAGFIYSDPDLVFSGTPYDRQDFAVHIATMRWTQDAGWVYSLPFTTETTASQPVKLAYVALGELSGLLNWDPVIVYHLARFAFGWVALVMLYAVVARVFESQWERRFAFLLASLASGLGWLQLILGFLPDPSISPIDFWLIDTYVFYGLMLFPHFALVSICLLGALLGYESYLSRNDIWGWLAALVSVLVIIAIQPFSALIVDLCLAGLILGAWRAANRVTLKQLVPLAVLGIMQIPAVWFNLAAFNYDEVWRSFGAQMILMSPPPVYYLLGLGILTPFAIYGGWLAWRDRNQMALMASFWVLCMLILLYIPTQFQRRFSFFLTIPLSLLAALGINALAGRLGSFKRTTRTAQILILLLASVSSIYLSIGGVLLVLSRHEEIYDPVELIQALEWLDSRATRSDCVISEPRTGLVVPTVSWLRSYVGHPIETAFYEAKNEAVQRFLRSEMSPQESQRFLADANCRWILLGPYENTLPDKIQDNVPSLEVAYARDGVYILEWLEWEEGTP